MCVFGLLNIYLLELDSQGLDSKITHTQQYEYERKKYGTEPYTVYTSDHVCDSAPEKFTLPSGFPPMSSPVYFFLNVNFIVLLQPGYAYPLT